MCVCQALLGILDNELNVERKRGWIVHHCKDFGFRQFVCFHFLNEADDVLVVLMLAGGVFKVLNCLKMTNHDMNFILAV